MFKLQSKTGGGVAIKSPGLSWQDALYFLTTVGIVITDQLTKTWARSYAEGYVIFQSPLFQFVRGQNTGAIFGIFQGFSALLTVVTSVVIIGILASVFLLWRRSYILDNSLARIAVSLYLGGAIGNFIDRMKFGSVTDFFDFRVWPSFNVADASMTVAVIMFVYSLLFIARPEKVNKVSSAVNEKNHRANV